ncbi:MAG: outer membrane protein assembly factor BamE [Proteobacteria bacterium]|nr:outer membrane protein assembly factor BamE [Pseudomonadota bacterium]
MKKLILCLGMVVALISGCASSGNAAIKEETNETLAQKIQIGKTTQSQIRSMFGEPMSTGTGATVQETSWMYMFTGYRADAKTFIPIVGGFIGSSNTQHNMLTINFDKRGIVSNYRFNASNMKAGMMQ